MPQNAKEVIRNKRFYGSLQEIREIEELVENATLDSLVTSVSGVCFEASAELKEVLKNEGLEKVAEIESDPFDLKEAPHGFLVAKNDDSLVIIDPTWRQFGGSYIPTSIAITYGDDTDDDTPQVFSESLQLAIAQAKEEGPDRPNILTIEIPNNLTVEEKINCVTCELDKMPEIPKWAHSYWVGGLLIYLIKAAKVKRKRLREQNENIPESLERERFDAENLKIQKNQYYEGLRQATLQNSEFIQEMEAKQNRFKVWLDSFSENSNENL